MDTIHFLVTQAFTVPIIWNLFLYMPYSSVQCCFLSVTNIESDNPKKFVLILQKFVYENSLYSLDEYFELQKVNLFIYDLN